MLQFAKAQFIPSNFTCAKSNTYLKINLVKFEVRCLLILKLDVILHDVCIRFSNLFGQFIYFLVKLPLISLQKTEFKLTDLHLCISHMHKIVSNAANSNLQAVREKYRESR